VEESSKGVPPNVRNDLVVAQETRQKIEIAQMRRTIRQMQNEITRLKRDEILLHQIKMQDSHYKIKE
jgi:hypothetical protein